MNHINITLCSPAIVITEVKRKTKAGMFCDLNIGDRIEFSVPLKYAGRSRNGTYATYITVTNLETGEKTMLSFNQLPKILDAFSFTDNVLAEMSSK